MTSPGPTARTRLKFGFSWALYKKAQDYFADTEGQYNFNGTFTGMDFADFLLGYAQQYEEDAVKSSGQWNNVSYASYVQDNWRVNRRLTLNLGLRWDIAPHTYEANQQSANFYPTCIIHQCCDLRHRRFHLQWPGRPWLQCRQSGLGNESQPDLGGLAVL